MMAVFFDTSTSADETIAAVQQIRTLADKQCYVSGLSALVTDLKALCEKEEPIYVTIAVLCALGAMMLLLDSWVAPVLFLMSIGVAILWNMFCRRCSTSSSASSGSVSRKRTSRLRVSAASAANSARARAR